MRFLSSRPIWMRFRSAMARPLPPGILNPKLPGRAYGAADMKCPSMAAHPILSTLILGQFNDDLRGKKVRGRVVGSKLVLYDDRGRELTMQGFPAVRQSLPGQRIRSNSSFFRYRDRARLRAPDGSIMRIGYASQNGRSYTGIGRLMKKRGLLGPGESSMQGIVSWLRRNPAEGRAIMRENKSYVFFREITGGRPAGRYGLSGGRRNQRGG